MRSLVGCCGAAAIGLLLCAGPSHGQVASDTIDPPDTAYFTGLIEESPQTLDKFARAPKFRNFLPESVDLSSNFPPPGDQGKQGSCVGWSVGYAARAYYVSAGEGRSLSRRANIPSPAYIYNLTLSRSEVTNCGHGMMISEALDTLKEGGVSLADYPYDERRCSPPPSSVIEAASQFRIRDSQTIARNELDTIKGELAQGNPVVFGMRVTRGFIRHRGARVYERHDADFVGSHAMVLIGYDEGRQAFRLQNSWGRGWGDGGRAWLSYAAFRRDANDAFVMRPEGGAPRPRPTPGPSPEPNPPEVVSLDLQCAKVIVAREGGKRIARGFVGKREDLDRVREKLPDVEIALDVRPWPQCEALLTLDRALAATDRPSIAFSGAASIFARGDTVSFHVSAPNAPVHLHVVYFQADGSVVHLVQSDAQNLRTFARGEKIVFGDGKQGRPAFRVSPPFGPEMALVLASRSPIFPEPRPRQETEREFLTALRGALAWNTDGGQKQREVSAAYVAATTQDK
jgi:hypothetical protein